jgi:pyruvate dehydrogenase E2 component (dihydrolipoamide acetyltransferase)
VIGYISDSPQQADEDQAGVPEKTSSEKTPITPKEKEREEGGTENQARSPSPPAVQTVTGEKPATHTVQSVPAPPATVPIGQQGIKASPYARGLARELGIGLQEVDSASDGVIHAPQVLAAALAGPAPNLDAGPAYRLEPLTSMHKAVANNMIATLATPTFRVSARLPLAPLRAMAHAQQQSLTLLLARACALCVQQHPHFNAVYTPSALAVREQVDIGIAVDVPGGLLTPVLRDAARRPLDELAEDWRILRDKIKRNRLAPDDYQGATFYLSNLGVFEQVTHFDALVPPGAAAILALGAEQDGRAEFTLSCDHRVVFGADAARFLASLSQMLDEPQGILFDAAKDQ